MNYFEDQHVGFPLSRSAPIASGGTLFEGAPNFDVATFGKIQQVVTAGTALVNPEGLLERFDFVMLADQVQRWLEKSGQRDHHEVDRAGETSTLRFDVNDPPHAEDVARERDSFTRAGR